MRGRSRFGWVVVLTGAALGGPFALAAQNPDSVAADTILTDSLRRGVDETQKLLDGEAQELIRVPVMPALGSDGPAPALSRIILDRDSIDWHDAETLGDLLQAQPGVYLWRAGWTGQPEYPDYQGRGAASVRYFLDGVPWLPMGPDSAAVDPASFPLTLLQRIEIERWPGQLVVRLYTRRDDRLAPRSRIVVAAGDRKFARFGGGLERHYASGLSFSLGAEYLNAPTRSGENTNASDLAILLRGGYVPSARMGFEYQVLRTSPQRDTWQLVAGSDSLSHSLKGDRTDGYLRGFYRTGKEGDGAEFDVLAGSSHWSGDSVSQTAGLFGATASFRRPTWKLEGSALSWSRWTPLDTRVDGGWTPVTGLAVSGEAVHQAHDGGRESNWIGLQAGITLPQSLVLEGSVRAGREVGAPAVLTDPAQELKDWRVSAGWQRRVVGLEAAWVHTAEYRPLGFQPYIQVPTLAPVGAADWLEVSARVSPRQWLLLEARYGDPERGTVDGVPPTHSIITATIRSKFLRQYRSGIFDLKLQLAMEAWGKGIIGRDTTGAAVTLPGATFFRGQFELKIGSLIFYYTRINLRNSLLSYVPGFQIPTGGQTFGVRWEFVN
ncbi:MAG TPA: TonB-dependent receptor plug domain-containing protein [Gemmatimonadales bacterium]|nr:TonB-dependent receptor plug domain-containing protein [Gemmatimonadales bacterium]